MDCTNLSPLTTNITIPNIANVANRTHSIEEYEVQKVAFYRFEQQLSGYLNCVGLEGWQGIASNIQDIKIVAENIENVTNLVKYNAVIEEIKKFDIDENDTFENQFFQVVNFLYKLKEVVQ